MSTTQTFLLPDLGEGLTEAEVISWKVAVGDLLEVDQVVVEVETAKAAVEVPCPFAGRVSQLHAEPGVVLPVGQPLITVEPAEAPLVAQEPGDEPAAHATYREEERAGSGNVLIGYGTGHGGSGRRRRRVGAAHGPAKGETTSQQADADASDAPGARAPRVISPIVRKLARDGGVDVAALAGTGPGGVVRRCDVEAALASSSAPSPVIMQSRHQVAEVHDHDEGVVGDGAGGDVRIPLRGTRRAIAEKLSTSRREIPEVTVWVDVDATGLLDARRVLNEAHPEQKVSVLALLARITLHALQRFPELNSRVDMAAGEIVQSKAVHLGIAAQTDRGLMVPVVRDAHRMTTLELAVALQQTTTEAREGTLAPSRLTGGTFTLNNYGVFGVDGSTPIINHPEAAILGIGRIVDKPWVVDGQLAVRKVTQLSLAFDHRVCDGGVAGGFLRYVADCVERPVQMLALV